MDTNYQYFIAIESESSIQMSTIEPISHGKQLLLQRLMASHVLRAEEAKTLFNELNDSHCSSLDQCWKEINSSLLPAFGLEVATISLHGHRYHAVINHHVDDIAKQAFSNLTPHVKAYIRLLLEFLTEQDQGSRMDLINIRTKADKPYKILTIQESELALDNLIDEHWLICNDNENRRASMSQEYTLGPRSYLELGHLLKDFGMDDMPQMIYHRAV
jgi:hypothetical protein